MYLYAPPFSIVKKQFGKYEVSDILGGKYIFQGDNLSKTLLLVGEESDKEREEDYAPLVEAGFFTYTKHLRKNYFNYREVAYRIGKNSGIWYRIVLDGKYNDTSAGWKFEQTGIAVIKFSEQSEHLLEFYCIDNVGKTSETDSELFKVTGTAFDLVIGDKWDLISVPFNLIGGGNIDDLFGDKVIQVWSYENGEWKVYSSTGPSNLHNIVPGRGYWIKTTDESNVLIGGSLFAPGPSLPSSIELDKGWNLIGHYGLSSKPAYCSLFSLVDTQQGFPRWSSLWSYNSASQQFLGLNSLDLMDPGRGYWIEIDVEDYYSPSSICWGFQ